MTGLRIPANLRRITAAAALGSALLTTAACGGGDAEAPADQGPTPEPTGQAITMAEVQENSTTDSCWAVIEQHVYDLTEWIDSHPGGPTRIEQLCGTDATGDFTRQHSGQERPEQQLAEFAIGYVEE